MTIVLFIIAVLGLGVGGLFFWLNLNNPVQTKIPLYLLPIGVCSALIWLSKIL